ncbi:MAG: LysR family transcriptional regulator [Dactylosporangium sp.]|nr:LysR family transcriptional regulator [Dactylosporangium sp.]
MDTRLLRTFVSVHDTGSFTATAQELAFAQSTITAHIQALEQRLGVRLFDRLPGRAVLTAHGRRLLPLARQILNLAAQAERIAHPVEEQVVRLVAPDTLCGHRLPRAAVLLRRTHPQVRLSLTAAGTAAALDALDTGAADLALVFESELPGGRRGVRIGVERLAVICPPQHPLAGRRATWQRLAEYPFLLLEEGCGYSDAVARRLTLAAGGRVRLSRFGSAEAVRAGRAPPPLAAGPPPQAPAAGRRRR